MITNHTPNLKLSASENIKMEASELAPCVVIFCVHHAISDGVGLVQILMDMGECSYTEYFQREKEEGRKKNVGKKKESKWMKIWHMIWSMLVSIFLFMTGQDFGLLKKEVHSMLKPKGLISGKRKVKWTPKGFTLEEVKQIGHKYKVTVNDVLLNVVAGAYQAFISKKQQIQKNGFIRLVLPVNFRPEEKNLKVCLKST